MSVILNNNVLALILNELNVRQLLRLERVSQQFVDCVGSALQRKNGLAIGEINWDVVCEDKTQSLSDGDLNGFKARIATILKRCPNIASLYLNKCLHEWYALRSIANYCPKLECLTIMDTNGCLYTEEEWTSLAKRLSTPALKHLTINYIEVMAIDCDKRLNWTTILLHNCWQTLCKLTLYKYNQSLNNIFDCLPQNIKQLSLRQCHGLDMQSINVLINCKHLDEIYLDFDETFHVALIETIFTTITEYLMLKKFAFRCEHLSMQSLNTIIRQKHLKTFDFESNDVICINAIDWYQMPEMRSLVLHDICIDLKRNQNLSKCLPKNLTHFDCNCINFLCKCEPMVDKCDTCNISYIQYLSQLARWMAFMCMDIDYSFANHHQVFNYLHLFNKYKCLTLCYTPEIRELDLINDSAAKLWLKYMVKTIAFKVIAANVLTNCFTLELCKPIYDEVMREMNDRGICVPNNYEIKCIDDCD